MIEEIDQETGGIDMLIEIDLLIGGDVEVEIETTVTGETTLMTGLEDAARTLLTLGPVAEAKVLSESLQPGLKALKSLRLA